MQTTTELIPDSLLYEEFRGRKYYRRGTRQVMLGLKTESEILGSSVYQMLIVQSIAFYLKSILPKGRYWIPSSEGGLHLGKNENLACDIAIIEKATLRDPTSLKYLDSPPKFVIEVDIKIEWKNYDTQPPTSLEMDYVMLKTDRLLDFGVEGVAWVLSQSRKILLALPGHRPQFFDWAEEVPLFGGHTFCLRLFWRRKGYCQPLNPNRRLTPQPCRLVRDYLRLQLVKHRVQPKVRPVDVQPVLRSPRDL